MNAAAVSAVSGEQILKAIVDAAKDGGGKVAVDDVKNAKNPIEAAIGSSGNNKDADAFATLTKDDQIAAAIVLRGMAKDGEFAFIAFIVIHLILLLYTYIILI
ncbi:variable large family protein [Borreliella garinii]|uniref:variable large family protein n=1 Tax=Borreliella garinii TaxID=29519 RepID=UPI00018ACFBA|nr:vls recombination cassette Vls3 [Borreliella garinii Far04]